MQTPTHTSGTLTVPISSIIIPSDRVREDTPEVREYILNELAPSIAERGIIHPPVVNIHADGRIELISGWCRTQACISLGLTEIPVNTREQLSAREAHILELEENIKRKQMSFRDEMLGLERLHKLLSAEGLNSSEHKWSQRQTGRHLGVSHGYVNEALTTARLMRAGDAEICACKSLLEVRALRAKRKLDEGAKILQERAKHQLVTKSSEPIKPKIKLVSSTSSIIEPQVEVLPPSKPTHHVELSSMLFNMDCHEWMAQREPESIDGIYTDIPYGIDMANLEGQDGLERTRDAHDVDENMAQFPKFISGAYRVLRDKSYLLFFYALEHHNLLRDMCLDAGFTVQAWPCVWIKPTAKNQAPHCWFTKSMEWVMVCRKGTASLLKPQPKNYCVAASVQESKIYLHPFYKSWDFSRWLLDSIVIPGQTWLDPYCGEGSLLKVLMEKQAKFIGIELDDKHFPRLVEHMKRDIQHQLGGQVEFS